MQHVCTAHKLTHTRHTTHTQSAYTRARTYNQSTRMHAPALHISTAQCPLIAIKARMTTTFHVSTTLCSQPVYWTARGRLSNGRDWEDCTRCAFTQHMAALALDVVQILQHGVTITGPRVYAFMRLLM